MAAKKAEALKTEATDAATVELEFEGSKYTVPTFKHWGLEPREAWEDGKSISLLRSLLGASQWALVKARHPGMSSELTEALEMAVIEATTGVTLGEADN